MRQDYPTLDALITLSEQAPLGPEVAARLEERGDRLVAQGNVGYVVIDSRFIPPDRAQLVIDAFKLIKVQRDQHLTLYVPANNHHERLWSAVACEVDPVAPKRLRAKPDLSRRSAFRAEADDTLFVMRRGPFLVLFAVSGAAALIYEVVWTRLLTLHMGHGLAAASTVLAAFMGGLAAGAGAAGPLCRHAAAAARADSSMRPRDCDRGARARDAAAVDRGAAAARGDLRGRQRRRDVRLRAPGNERAPALRAGGVHGRDVSDRIAVDRANARQHAAQDAGGLYAANTLGAAAGAVLAGFALIPALGLRGTTLVGVALNVIAAAGAWLLIRAELLMP